MTYIPRPAGITVAGQSKLEHPLIYLRRLTELGKRSLKRVTEMGKGADLRGLTETGKRKG